MPFGRSICLAQPLLALALAGCNNQAAILGNEDRSPVDKDRYALLARFVHISDAQIVDEESPGRLTFVAGLSRSAWRRQEAYSVHLLDGMIRTVNKLHEAEHRFNFLIHTGDACDNAQYNELQWFVGAFDGGEIDPLTGPDDRTPNQRPPTHLDPHRPFVAQGLYRHGVHGDAPTIPWFSVVGNHDRFGVGVFPIIEDTFDVLISPLPLHETRAGFFAPKYLDPIGKLSWGLITPAHPGPPLDLSIPRFVEPNPDRRFFTPVEFVRAHLQSTSDPPGHGFDTAEPTRTWYSVAPAPGLRLIVLNSSTPLFEVPTLTYSEGAISQKQRNFLEAELQKAQEAGEITIVATHHPSGSLEPVYGTALIPASFRSLLNKYPNVKLHIAGHWHTDLVIDHGGYTEIVTGSIIDPPQQGRIIEIWKATAAADGSPNDPPAVEFDIELRFWSFSHLDTIRPRHKEDAELFVDELFPIRREAADFVGVVPPDDRER